MSARRIESFLLRLVVQDDGTIDPGQWHGRIQHVATGDEQQIEQLQDAIAFIANRLEVSDPPLSATVLSYPEPSPSPRNVS